MTPPPKKCAISAPSPLRSPYPALQAILPRLRTLGTHQAHKPIFDDQSAVQDFLEEFDQQELHVVPVWAIDHTDLTGSHVVKWTFSRWLQ